MKKTRHTLTYLRPSPLAVGDVVDGRVVDDLGNKLRVAHIAEVVAIHRRDLPMLRLERVEIIEHSEHGASRVGAMAKA